jgi:hypothetical protein
MVEYSPQLGEEICLRIAAGETLKKICKGSSMPNKDTVIRWVLKKPDFAEMYNFARQVQAELLGDEILDIAKDNSNDKNEDGTPNHANVQRSRLEVDTIKWYLARINARKWGDKVTSEVTGKDGAPLVNIDLDAIARWLAFETSKPKAD